MVNVSNVARGIRELAKLKNDGHITEKEFEAKKGYLLSEIPGEVDTEEKPEKKSIEMQILEELKEIKKQLELLANPVFELEEFEIAEEDYKNLRGGEAKVFEFGPEYVKAARPARQELNKLTNYLIEEYPERFSRREVGQTPVDVAIGLLKEMELPEGLKNA